MKKNFVTIVFLCLFAMFPSISAAPASYKSSLEAALSKLDSAETLSDYQQCLVEFEHISEAYANEWLPVYYSAYCNIQMIYVSSRNKNDAEAISKLSEKAMKQLEKLQSSLKADSSEVQTLIGHYYASLVASNPSENGRKYYLQVLESYNKAIEHNPENPRPLCLRAVFCQYMPASLIPGINISEDKRKASALYAKDKKPLEQPYWGAEYLDYINITNK
ncbi:MAG: hypothetical protein LBH04_09425 [Tannerellaceae bacterium]|nr:hypothetical protein [Tannerellaceae bacterium]